MELTEVKLINHEPRTRREKEPRVGRVRAFVFYAKGSADLAKAELKQAALAAFTEAGLPRPLKLAFSQKAGCSCGCSPGYISDLQGPADVYADVRS